MGALSYCLLCSLTVVPTVMVPGCSTTLLGEVRRIEVNDWRSCSNQRRDLPEGETMAHSVGTARERVEFRKRTRDKLEARWVPGVFVGVKRLTSDKIFGNEHGVDVVQSIRTVDESSRWESFRCP